MVESVGLPMKTRLLSLVAASFLVPGCFSPEVDPELEGSEASDGSSSGTDTGAASTSAGTDDPTATTNPSTTDEPTTTTTNPSTTDEPTTTTDDPTTDDDSGSGGPDPFCGDGNLDPGEDCDDGDGNGLDQACLPDCNLNVCGDGNLAPDEVCDDGEGNNVLEVGACAPDCSTVIEEKVISLSSGFEGGNLQPNPVGFADGQCPAGRRALFAVAGVRQATNGTPLTADNPIDWPLAPYTAYVRSTGQLIWMTDATPLLGVRDGELEPLTNSILPACTNPPCVVTGPTITGLNTNWTTASSNNCNGWSSDSEAHQVRQGYPVSDTEYLSSSNEIPCALEGNNGFFLPHFLCVEQ